MITSLALRLADHLKVRLSYAASERHRTREPATSA